MPLESAREWVERAEGRIAQDIHFGNDDEVAKFGRILLDAYAAAVRGEAEARIAHWSDVDG